MSQRLDLDVDLVVDLDLDFDLDFDLDATDDVVCEAPPLEYDGAPWNPMPPLTLRSDRAGTPMADEVLTIREVAALLELAEKTRYSMAQAGEIPAFRIRGQWRIKRTELDRWIDARPRGGDSGGGDDDGR